MRNTVLRPLLVASSACLGVIASSGVGAQPYEYPNLAIPMAWTSGQGVSGRI